MCPEGAEEATFKSEGVRWGRGPQSFPEKKPELEERVGPKRCQGSPGR